MLGRRLGPSTCGSCARSIGHVNPRHPLRSALRVRDVVLTGLTNSWSRAAVGADAGAEERAERLMGTLGLAGRREAAGRRCRRASAAGC